MVQYYKYLFYKILCGLRKIPFADDTTEWGAMLFLASLILINFLTLFTIGQLFTGEKILPHITKEVGVILIASIYIPNYFLFLHKHRYKAIIKEFKDETTEKRKKGNCHTILYILGTVVLFFSLTIIKLTIWGR